MALGARDERSAPDIMMLGLRSLGSGQGGVEAHVERIAIEMDALGYSLEAVVRTPYAGKRRSMRGKAIRVVPLWSPRHQATEALVHSLLGVVYAAWRRPRLLHVHAIGPALVVPLARLFGLKVVFTHHGEDYNREKWGPLARTALRLGERFGAMFANARICVSPSLARQLSAQYGMPFAYIPNGVPRMSRLETSTHIGAMGLEPGRYILHVGRVVPEKRQLDLVEMIERIGVPGLKLALVGAADHASDYSREVSARAAASDNVVLCGFQTGDALRELFSQCAVFVLPSTHEGLPIALLEAMAYGCRLVASDIEANRNIGLPEDRYFPVGDLDGLCEGVRRALDRPSPMDWSERLAEFDWLRITQETVDVYQSVAPDLAKN